VVDKAQTELESFVSAVIHYYDRDNLHHHSQPTTATYEDKRVRPLRGRPLWGRPCSWVRVRRN